MLRIIAAVIFVLTGGIAGSAMADKLKRRQRICAVIGSLLRRVSFLIGYRCDDVYSVCSELRNDADFVSLSFLKALPVSYEKEGDFRTEWRSAVKMQRFCSDEENVLLRLGSIIGRSDINGQLEAIRALETELGEIEQNRNETYLRMGRLYRSVGLLFGAAAGIIVI